MDHRQYVGFDLRREASIDSNNSKDDENNNNNNNLDLKRGSWTVEEDSTLINHITLHGEGRWNSLARSAGLKRTGKSCRLRWLNYLRPDVRRGNITLEEQLLILQLHSRWGNRWSKIAQHLPGRTDNEIKNYWRTRVQKQAKQLKCDVNSKEFKDTLHYLWIPRLVERIQASSNSNNQVNIQKTNDNIIINNNIVPNMNFTQESYSSTTTTTSSENSIGTQISDMSDNCYPNYPLNQGDYGEILISPTGDYFQQGALDFRTVDIIDDNNDQQNISQLFLDDHVSDNLWNIDDMLFLQQQLN